MYSARARSYSPFAHIDEGEVAVGEGLFRFELDGAVVVGKRTVSVLAPLIDHAAIEINDRVVWFEARLKSASALSKSFIG